MKGKLFGLYLIACGVASFVEVHLLPGTQPFAAYAAGTLVGVGLARSFKKD